MYSHGYMSKHPLDNSAGSRQLDHHLLRLDTLFGLIAGILELVQTLANDQWVRFALQRAICQGRWYPFAPDRVADFIVNEGGTPT
jgi:hypothetical protein